MRARSAIVLVVVAVLLVSLAACGTADRGSPGPTGGGSAVPSAAASGGLSVSSAWVRAAATTANQTAGYLTIMNGGAQDDALTGAAAAFAGSVEVHETSMDSSGMAGMHPVDRIRIAAGATVKLEPGGYHLMVMGLKKVLAAGDTVELELTFERAGKVVVQAEVRQG